MQAIAIESLVEPLKLLLKGQNKLSDTESIKIADIGFGYG